MIKKISDPLSGIPMTIAIGELFAAGEVASIMAILAILTCIYPDQRRSRN